MCIESVGEMILTLASELGWVCNNCEHILTCNIPEKCSELMTDDSAELSIFIDKCNKFVEKV